jgi:hypothetical protein
MEMFMPSENKHPNPDAFLTTSFTAMVNEKLKTKKSFKEML